MNIQVKRIVAVVGKIAVAILLGLFVLAVGGTVITLLKIFPESSSTTPWLGPFFMHTTMLVVSVLLMLILSKGRIRAYGFKWVGIRELKPAILLSFVIGVAGAFVQTLQSSQVIAIPAQFTFGQVVIFVWIYASIGEEVLTRGLIQGYLVPLKELGISVFGLRLSLPIIVGALFFSLMHIAAFGSIEGIFPPLFFLLLATTLGIIAGYYREKTGSLLPAVIVHMIFNISDSLVNFLVGIFR